MSFFVPPQHKSDFQSLNVILHRLQNNSTIFKEQLTNISTVLNNTGNTTKLLTSFNALDVSQQKVLLSSSLLSEKQKELCMTMAVLSSANTKYTAEELAKATGISAETLANWGLIESTDTLTFSELAEKAASDAQAKTALEKIIAQNAQAVANGEVTASNIKLATSEGTAALATGSFTTAIKANIAAMLTWMTTTPLGWLTMLAGGIFLTVKAYNASAASIKKQKEKMDESVSAYENAKNELSNITTELKTQEQELDDLIAKDRSLTNEEQGRLAELQKITKELRIQKDLAAKEESKAQKELAGESSELFKKQFKNVDISQNKIDEYVEERKRNGDYGHLIVDNTNDISAMIAGYKIYNELLDDAYGSKNQQNIDDFSSVVETVHDEIFTVAQDLQEQKDAMTDYYEKIRNTPYDKLKTEDKEVVDSYNAISDAIELIYQNLDPNAWKSMQIDSVFDTEGIEKTKEELIELEKAGELDESTLLSYSKLSEALKENKLSASELHQELKALAEAEMEGQSSETSLDSPTLSLSDAKTKVNGLKDGDTEIIGLIEEYELLQEVLSDTGNIQEETYEKLLSCSSKYATAIRTENGRITVNTSKLKAVAKSRQMDTKEAIRQTLALKKQEWVQWNNRIENYNGTLLENIENTYGDIDALQSQITQYELLSNSIDDAADSFKNFKAAQSTNEQENYDTAQDAFNLVKDALYNAESEFYGKTNTDDFRIGIESIASEKMYRKLLNAKDQEEYLRISKEIVKTLEPLFGENGGKNLDSLFERANKIVDSGEIPKNDKEWADRLDISEEAFQAVKEHANLYQFNGNEYFGSGFTNTLDEYQSKLSNVKSAQDALNECTDKTSNEYIRLSKELDSAKEKYNEYADSAAKSLEEAYQSYISSGETQKGTFADYLKKSMDFDENDITGGIDVLIDRMDLLKDKMNMAEHASNSAAFDEYKKQFEELSELASVLGYKIDDSNNSKNVTYSDDGTDGMTVAINKYKELREQAQQCEETLKNSEKGSNAYNEAADNLEQIYTLMASINSSEFRIELKSNINDIDAEIEELDAKISMLQTSLSQAANPTVKSNIKEELNNALEQRKELVNQKSELEQTFKIVVDDEEFLSKIKEAQEAEIEDKSFEITVNADNAISVIDTVDKKKIADKDFFINVKLNNPTGVDINGAGNLAQTSSVMPSGKSSTKANGTVNSFAQGTGADVSIKNDEEALVNELGEEGVVRNGKLISIKGGAQFIKLKRGDIVFNHKQMEQLRKNGYTAGRGELIGAHADGTVNAYNGLNTYTTYNKHLVDRDWQHNPANPKNAVKQTQQAIEQAAEETAEEVEEISEEVFDWIERRIQKFQRLFDKWVKQAETALTSGFITKYYKKATSAIKKELSTYSKAYNRYMKEANAVGLDAGYAKKVRNGTIDIETIQDEELADKIQKYQEWYIYYAPLSGNRWRHSI